jgi:iron(III) transport system substrate-binding protein
VTERVWSRRLFRLAGLSAAIAIAGACSSPAASSTPAPAASATAPAATGSTAPASAAPGAALADVCAKGVEEGKLVQWNNHSDEFVKVTDAFKAAYPGIEVETLVIEPDDSAQRVLTESAGGRAPSADMIAGGLDIFKPLFDRDIAVLDIDWAGLGVPADVMHEMNLVRIHRVALGLGYNTTNLKPEDLPNTWEELIDPKWTGKVIVDPRGRPFDSLSLAWGHDETLDYVTRLKAGIAPLLIEGGTAGLVAVAGGEADITTGGRSAETQEQQAKGAPLAIKYLDVVSTIDNYDVVLAGAAHPNAATCFITWFATEGQDLYNEVEFKSNDAVPPEAPAGAEIVTIETPEQSTAVKDIGEEISAIFVGN